MNLKLEKKDYSKFKNKSIAVVTKSDTGRRFGLLLDETIGIDVEIYKLNCDEGFYMANSLIRELNNDENVLIIMVIMDDVLETLVKNEKIIRCEYPKMCSNDLVLHKEIMNLNIGKITDRLKELGE